jgi:outer membrane protein TolC
LGIPVALGQDDIEDAYYPFGRHNMVEIAFLAAHALEAVSQVQLDRVALVGTLSEAQRDKLELAGQGDIHRFLDQFEALMLNSKGILVSKKRERQNVMLSLSRLLGTYPENYDRPSLSEVDIPEAVQVGLPSDLLRLRPDIRQGENQLRANDLEVGIARTAFFPSFRLFGMAGFNAFEFSKLFLNPASTVYQLGAGLTAPLFNRGQIRAAYESAKANQQIALLDYEQTVLKSYLEVLGLVNDFSTLEEEIQLKNDEVIVQRRSVDNAGTMFKVGYADYLDVINAQSRSLESELDYINLKVAQLQSTVKLYRALGGGWQ